MKLENSASRESRESVDQQSVPISQIAPSPFQTRDHGVDDLEDLARSIRRIGLLTPLVVRRAGTGYELIAGHRRLRVLRSLEEHDDRFAIVDVRIVELDDHQARAAVLADNITHKELTTAEKITALDGLKEVHGTWDAVAKELGWSVDKIHSIRQLKDLPAEVFADSRLNEHQKRTILKSYTTDEERCEAAEEAVIEGLPASAIKRRAQAKAATASGGGASPGDAMTDTGEHLILRRQTAAAMQSRFARIARDIDAAVKDSPSDVVVNELLGLKQRIENIITRIDGSVSTKAA